MGIVIGPIDASTWYCMRQCRESIAYLKTKHNPIYDVEIKGEQEILRHFMNGIERKAA